MRFDGDHTARFITKDDLEEDGELKGGSEEENLDRDEAEAVQLDDVVRTKQDGWCGIRSGAKAAASLGAIDLPEVDVTFGDDPATKAFLFELQQRAVDAAYDGFSAAHEAAEADGASDAAVTKSALLESFMYATNNANGVVELITETDIEVWKEWFLRDFRGQPNTPQFADQLLLYGLGLALGIGINVVMENPDLSRGDPSVVLALDGKPSASFLHDGGHYDVIIDASWPDHPAKQGDKEPKRRAPRVNRGLAKLETTLAYAGRVSGLGKAFPTDILPPTDERGQDERELFTEMSGSYDAAVDFNHKKTGYDCFQRAWQDRYVGRSLAVGRPFAHAPLSQGPPKRDVSGCRH